MVEWISKNATIVVAVIQMHTKCGFWVLNGGFYMPDSLNKPNRIIVTVIAKAITAVIVWLSNVKAPADVSPKDSPPADAGPSSPPGGPGDAPPPEDAPPEDPV
jgi:hypothetical protein